MLCTLPESATEGMRHRIARRATPVSVSHPCYTQHHVCMHEFLHPCRRETAPCKGSRVHDVQHCLVKVADAHPDHCCRARPETHPESARLPMLTWAPDFAGRLAPPPIPLSSGAKAGAILTAASSLPVGLRAAAAAARQWAVGNVAVGRRRRLGGGRACGPPRVAAGPLRTCAHCGPRARLPPTQEV